jgi:hypothetical protein
MHKKSNADAATAHTRVWKPVTLMTCHDSSQPGAKQWASHEPSPGHSERETRILQAEDAAASASTRVTNPQSELKCPCGRMRLLPRICPTIYNDAAHDHVHSLLASGVASNKMGDNFWIKMSARG